MKADRKSGILLHVSSLPSYGGVGDLGPAAYAFADFLAEAKQRMWQVLPLNPTGYGNSPYAALSAFAGNPLLISVEELARAGWLEWHRIEGLPGHWGNADFEAATRLKVPLIEEAAGNFLDRANEAGRARFENFCAENADWLDDYAAFTVLRRMHELTCWVDWPREYAFREGAAMERLKTSQARGLAVEKAVQFFFAEQWSGLRRYCGEREIEIMGDVAIFVNYDSADVWVTPEIFELDKDREPIRVSGVPPDYFSETGQRWGNPLYKWDLLKKDGFGWWVKRIKRALALYDVIRLDHFRGFEAYWAIPAEDATAMNGKWVKAPGRALFKRLKAVLGDLPFVAEDLGLITPEVDALREEFAMPGMRILQFGFSDRGAHMYLPHMFEPNTVAYTGTHDNNTTLGWWREGVTDVERANVQTYLGGVRHEGEIVWAMMRAAAGSVANLCVFPLQDVLHLGSEARMNTPSAAEGNWSWRYAPGALHHDFARHMAALMELTDRDGYVAPAKEEDAASE